jgi:hypothetical protein
MVGLIRFIRFEIRGLLQLGSNLQSTPLRELGGFYSKGAHLATPNLATAVRLICIAPRSKPCSSFLPLLIAKYRHAHAFSRYEIRL